MTLELGSIFGNRVAFATKEYNCITLLSCLHNITNRIFLALALALTFAPLEALSLDRELAEAPLVMSVDRPGRCAWHAGLLAHSAGPTNQELLHHHWNLRIVR